MVINYDNVILSFQNHSNLLQHVIIDYESETVKSVNLVIDYISLVQEWDATSLFLRWLSKRLMLTRRRGFFMSTQKVTDVNFKIYVGPESNRRKV